MEEKVKIDIPKYQQIAIDLAFKIVKQQYKVGEKIYARSSIASQYGVSSETARRAICVLADLDIVDSAKGSGVVIKSYEKAVQFVKQYQEVHTINDLKKEIMNDINRQKKEVEILYAHLSELIDKTDRFRAINPFVPFELEITEATPYLNQSIADINFWHNTSATIIGIKRGDRLLMSPGPYATLSNGDIYYFVGDEDALEKVRLFLYPHET